MSIFLKYTNENLLSISRKTITSKVYLTKYFKPYKTPVRLSLLIISYFFCSFYTVFNNNPKPLLNINLFTNKLLHHSFLAALIIN